MCVDILWVSMRDRGLGGDQREENSISCFDSGYTHLLLCLSRSACHVGNPHLVGNHVGDNMRSERAWMVSIKHYTERKACEWKSKLTSLKMDACYTEKIQVGTTFPSMCSPPRFILLNGSVKCGWEMLTILSPSEGQKSLTSCFASHDKMIMVKAFFCMPHPKTFRLNNALEFVQRWWVQSSRLGYKHLQKCFAEFLLWARIAWAGEVSLVSSGGADSNVWIIQHFH